MYNKNTIFNMQRIYDMPKKKKMDTTEFFELREDQQQPAQDPSTAAYKIPSSSNLINNNKTSTNYKASFNAYEPEKHQSSNLQTPYISPRSIHCIVIADHIMDCPLCSRFYRNYTPFYNIVIMILLMIVIFLFIRCQKLSILSVKPVSPH